MVMEIIRTDSENHHRVQELIATTLESGTVTFSPDDFLEVWDLIENHIKTEKNAEALAQETLEALKGKKMGVQSDIILPKDILEDIAGRKPKDVPELKKVMEEVPWRFNHFGGEILQIIT